MLHCHATLTMGDLPNHHFAINQKELEIPYIER